MKQMACGTIALLGIFAIAGCYTDPTKDFNNDTYTKVQATPVFAVVKTGDSSQVLVRLVNPADNGAVTSFAVSAVGSGIRVDSACTTPSLTPAQQVSAGCYGYYRPVFDATKDTLVPTTDKNTQQFFILATSPGKWTFTLTPRSVNTGISSTVTVIVSPIDLGPALSPTTGLHAGDQVTITAPANVVFSSTSVVSFTKGPNPAIVGLSADSSTLTILVAPGDSGAATVTKVGQVSAPTAAAQTLVTTNSIALVPPITVAPTTVSTTTPAFGATMTVTLGGGLRFLGNSVVSIGGRDAFMISTSADSSTATIVPFGGSTGMVSYTNIALSFLTSVPLSIPGDKSVTVGPVTSNANALNPATAPTFVLPDSGATAVLSDGGGYTPGGVCGALGGGDGCRYYRVTIPAGRSYDVTLKWDPASTTDMGVYIADATGTAKASSQAADNAGPQAGGPETATFTLDPGTYTWAIVWFAYAGAAPPFFQLQVTAH